MLCVQYSGWTVLSLPSLNFFYFFFIGIHLHSLLPFISIISFCPLNINLLSPLSSLKGPILSLCPFLCMTFALINLPVFPLGILFVYCFQGPEIWEREDRPSGPIQRDGRPVTAVCWLKWLQTVTLLLKTCLQTWNHSLRCSPVRNFKANISSQIFGIEDRLDIRQEMLRINSIWTNKLNQWLSWLPFAKIIKSICLLLFSNKFQAKFL